MYPSFELRTVILSGVAGGVAACDAKTVVAPLGRVKILFQASNSEYQKFSVLFRCKSATLLGIFPYAAIKFLAYNEVHNILIPNSGAIAGAIAVLFNYLLELLRVCMAFHTIHGSTSLCPHCPSFLRTAHFISKRQRAAHIDDADPDQVRPIPHPPAPQTLLQLLHQPRRYRALRRNRVLTWDYLHTATLVPISTDGRCPRATPLADLGIGAFAGAAEHSVL
ncbi:putative mitochondrial carrier C17H9.08 [Lactarius tabidus]